MKRRIQNIYFDLAIKVTAFYCGTPVFIEVIAAVRMGGVHRGFYLLSTAR